MFHVDSPLPAAFDRVLQVFLNYIYALRIPVYNKIIKILRSETCFIILMQFGDASGIQSPVSFGGFGSLTRHLSRLTIGMYTYMVMKYRWLIVLREIRL